MVVKITQVGTVSEALAACREALAHGYNAPCGSRATAYVGDFAVGSTPGRCASPAITGCWTSKKTRCWRMGKAAQGVRNRQ